MSAIDGLPVTFRYRSDFIGMVQGDSYMPGTVRVDWEKPHAHTGIHAVTDLIVLPHEKETEENGPST